MDREQTKLIDRVGIGLLAAVSYLIFHVLFYGIVILSVRNVTPGVEEFLVFLLSMFIWGPIISFVIGFALMINPIEIIFKLFD